MEPRRDSLRLLLRDIGVSLALIFGGIGLAGVAARWIGDVIGKESSLVYVFCLLVAMIPIVLWIRYCNGFKLDRRQAGFVVGAPLIFATIQDLMPAVWQNNPKIMGGVVTIVFALVRLAMHCTQASPDEDDPPAEGTTESLAD